MDATGQNDVGVAADNNTDWGNVGQEEGYGGAGSAEREENVAPPQDEYEYNEQEEVVEAEAPAGEEDADDGYGDTPVWEPKAPPRTTAPPAYRAWLQDKHSSLMTQAVVRDDVEAITWMLRYELVDLAATDDLGNTAAHLAVFHDSPRVLRLLHDLGVDLSATCDAENFGSAIFYSVYLGRVQCLEELIEVGYDMSRPCDRFKRTPETVAVRHDQGAALVLVQRSLAALDVQRLTRGFLGRQKANRIKAAWGKAEAREQKQQAVV